MDLNRSNSFGATETMSFWTDTKGLSVVTTADPKYLFVEADAKRIDVVRPYMEMKEIDGIWHTEAEKSGRLGWIIKADKRPFINYFLYNVHYVRTPPHQRERKADKASIYAIGAEELRVLMMLMSDHLLTLIRTGGDGTFPIPVAAQSQGLTAGLVVKPLTPDNEALRQVISNATTYSRAYKVLIARADYFPDFADLLTRYIISRGDDLRRGDCVTTGRVIEQAGPPNVYVYDGDVLEPITKTPREYTAVPRSMKFPEFPPRYWDGLSNAHLHIWVDFGYVGTNPEALVEYEENPVVSNGQNSERTVAIRFTIPDKKGTDTTITRVYFTNLDPNNSKFSYDDVMKLIANPEVLYKPYGLHNIMADLERLSIRDADESESEDESGSESEGEESPAVPILPTFPPLLANAADEIRNPGSAANPMPAGLGRINTPSSIQDRMQPSSQLSLPGLVGSVQRDDSKRFVVAGLGPSVLSDPSLSSGSLYDRARRAGLMPAPVQMPAELLPSAVAAPPAATVFPTVVALPMPPDG